MASTSTGYDPRDIPVPRAGREPAGNGARSGGSVHGPLGDLDVASLRHPTEPSRFALALVALALPVGIALFVLVSLGQTATLIGIFAAVVVVVLLIWVVVQILRIRLLGDAVLVTAQTLPEVQEVVDVVRARLAYDRRVDLFVVDKISRVLSGDAAPITLTSFFGVHVLVAEGDALGDLADARERQQLLFTLATYVGALKARYAAWWSPLFSAFQMTGLTSFVLPFIYPYYRATVFSGDRIAYACCGDLGVSLQSVYRALVGKEVAKHLRAEGLTGQALVARRRALLRFAQLLRPTPHATNRYLNLLAFVQRCSPQEFAEHRPPLAGAEAEPVLATLGGRRAHPGVVPVAVGLAVAVLGAGLTLGLGARDSTIARGIATAFGAATDSGGDGAGGGSTTTTTPSPTASPTTPTNPSAVMLLGLVPDDQRAGCTTVAADPAAGELASLSCSLPAGGPQQLVLSAYESPDAMSAAFDNLVGGLPAGDCSAGGVRTTWTYQGSTQGPMACYQSTAGYTSILWGSDAKAVLVLAQDSTLSPPLLLQWWTSAPYLQ